jgi:hypothetical protein
MPDAAICNGLDSRVFIIIGDGALNMTIRVKLLEVMVIFSIFA